MNISKKKSEPVKQVQQKKSANLSEVQKKLYTPLLDHQIPYGKYKGRELRYVKDNEPWYWQFMWDNELLWEWGMMVLKSDAMNVKPKKPTGFVASDGSIWIGLRIVEDI